MIDDPDRLTGSGRTRHLAATPDGLSALLRELDVNPPGRPTFKLVSRWAAKHVWQVSVNGEAWAYIRYLIGSADDYPDRWRHMQLSTILHDAHVGPRVLGLTPKSNVLGRRAAIVEAALKPITREEIEARAVEAITLFSRLHTYVPLRAALYGNLTEVDIERMQPIQRLFSETRERWFEAVAGRWLEAGLVEISDATEIVSELINRIEAEIPAPEPITLIVPTHNDPNQGNFMVNRQGRLRMIDFEELTLSHPVADLGIFLTWFADRDQHRELLKHYPLSNPDDLLERMATWVPLRYIGIAAHWAARLTKVKNKEGWVYAANSIDEWLRGAAEIVFDGELPFSIADRLDTLHAVLLNRWPLESTQNKTD
ncbi:MAG: aminoglycoside phosphotransferase family protein [Anaerolineae bacterium]|nr:aminoglycoside phosphotransferase family protein [Anaerolineae bacterium]